jgi:hypothetical protein
MDKDFDVVILSACRTPIGTFGGEETPSRHGVALHWRRGGDRDRR